MSIKKIEVMKYTDGEGFEPPGLIAHGISSAAP